MRDCLDQTLFKGIIKNIVKNSVITTLDLLKNTKNLKNFLCLLGLIYDLFVILTLKILLFLLVVTNLFREFYYTITF